MDDHDEVEARTVMTDEDRRLVDKAEAEYRRAVRAEKVGEALKFSGAMTILSGWVVAVVVACYEGFLWLQSGQWPMLALDLIFRALPLQTLSWLAQPDSWIGLHKLVFAFIFLPLSIQVGVLATGVGFVVLFIGQLVGEE